MTHLFLSHNNYKAVAVQINNALHYSDAQFKRSFVAASLIKLPIMLYIYTYKKDELTHLVPLTSHVEGCGISSYLSCPFTLYDLTLMMITVSDNAATNTLIDYIGINTLNCYFIDLGLHSTSLNRYMMHPGKENTTSAEDILHILKLIMQHPCSEDMFLLMKRQQLREKILLNLTDEAIEIGTKSGELADVQHEAGIIRYQNNIMYFVCLTEVHDAAIHSYFHSFGPMLKAAIRNEPPCFPPHKYPHNDLY